MSTLGTGVDDHGVDENNKKKRDEKKRVETQVFSTQGKTSCPKRGVKEKKAKQGGIDRRVRPL